MKEIKDSKGNVIGMTNDVMINDIELASELAHYSTLDEMLINIDLSDEDLVEEGVYVKDEDGNTTYTEKAQDIFNGWYDYYSTKIESVATVPMETVYKTELDALKAEFEQYKRESIKWSVEDMTGKADEIDYVLTDEQAQDALERMIQKHDAEYGVSWESVDYFVREYGTKKVDDGTLVEVTEEQAIEYFNKGVEVWVEDEKGYETKNEDTGKYERLKTVYSLAEGDVVEDVMARNTRLLIEADDVE